MSETPRARLKSLMDGLELPKGFKLTAAREDALRALGILLVKHGKLQCYGPKVSFGRMHMRYTVSMSRSAKAALRGMARAGWVKAMVPLQTGGIRPMPVNRWNTCDVVFQDGIEQLALRLGARRMLWDERKEQLLDGARVAYEAMRGRLWKAQEIVRNASYAPTVGENDVLDAYRKLRALTTEVSAAEKELASAKVAVNGVPEPTEDEAFTWLMKRRLNGTNA